MLLTTISARINKTAAKIGKTNGFMEACTNLIYDAGCVVGMKLVIANAAETRRQQLRQPFRERLRVRSQLNRCSGKRSQLERQTKTCGRGRMRATEIAYRQCVFLLARMRNYAQSMMRPSTRSYARQYNMIIKLKTGATQQMAKMCARLRVPSKSWHSRV